MNESYVYERHKHTPRNEEDIKAYQNRLNRMIGQLNGIKNMLDDNRYCGDILTQISAVNSALKALGYQILQEHMETCVVEQIQHGDTKAIAECVSLIKKL